MSEPIPVHDEEIASAQAAVRWADAPYNPAALTLASAVDQLTRERDTAMRLGAQYELAARLANRKLEALGAEPMRAISCRRSDTGHHHLTRDLPRIRQLQAEARRAAGVVGHV
jgi:hypothetical protein